MASESAHHGLDLVAAAAATDRDARLPPSPDKIAPAPDAPEKLLATATYPLLGSSVAADLSQQQTLPSSSSNSQDSLLHDADLVNTPPSDMSTGPGAGSESQDSQSFLPLVTQFAPPRDAIGMADAPSRKRMADGMVKPREPHDQERMSASPVRSHGHSRNTSTVSIASTNGSRIGELSAELKARLSYAMIKVSHGWQSNTIDEVESLASQAVSPSTTSSNSTIHGRHRASASPRLPSTKNSDMGSQNYASAQSYQALTKGSGANSAKTSASPPNVPTLAPPAPIEPARSQPGARRNSNHKYTPTLLSHSQPSPRTPLPSGPINSAHATPRERIVDPILFSPHQNVREQDAIETLLFMSSPGNSANMKHSFSPSSQSQPARHALPTSQPRKSLPSHRPPPSKRVGFHKSPGGFSDMDIDSPRIDSPHASSQGTPRRRPINHHRTAIPLPSGLGVSASKRRPTLGDEDIERMLDRAQAESSDEDEIQIPINRSRDSAGVVGV